MSRSYKHTPVLKYAPSSRHNGALWAKRQANKKVRRSFCYHNSYYKRVYPQWDIHDCIGYWSWQMSVEHYYQCRNSHWTRHIERKPNFLRWAKFYLRK